MPSCKVFVEAVLKWLTEAEELNDDTWDTFQKQLKAMGIDECMQYYQNALDRFNAR